jgi:hypothetical protein
VEEAESREEETGITAVPVAPSVPEWLREDASKTWVVPEPPTQVSATPLPETKSKPAPKAQPGKAAKPPQPVARRKPAQRKPRTKQEKTSQLNLALGGLIIAMILVIFILLYVAL